MVTSILITASCQLVCQSCPKCEDIGTALLTRCWLDVNTPALTTLACRSKVIGHCPRSGLVIEPQFVEVINQLPQQLRNLLHAGEVLLESLARM